MSEGEQGTVQDHVRAGRIRPLRRTTGAALELAATWLEHYEGDSVEDAEELTELASVALYLRNQAAKRKS